MAKSGPKLCATERAIIVARVRKGESKASVARSMGVSASAVSQLANSRIAATSAAIAAETMAGELMHPLHEAAAKEQFILDVTQRLLSMPEHFGAGAARVAAQNLMDAAKLMGQVIDKREMSGPNGGAIPISGITITVVAPERKNGE